MCTCGMDMATQQLRPATLSNTVRRLGFRFSGRADTALRVAVLPPAPAAVLAALGALAILVRARKTTADSTPE